MNFGSGRGGKKKYLTFVRPHLEYFLGSNTQNIKSKVKTLAAQLINDGIQLVFDSSSYKDMDDILSKIGIAIKNKQKKNKRIILDIDNEDKIMEGFMDKLESIFTWDLTEGVCPYGIYEENDVIHIYIPNPSLGTIKFFKSKKRAQFEAIFESTEKGRRSSKIEVHITKQPIFVGAVEESGSFYSSSSSFSSGANERVLIPGAELYDVYKLNLKINKLDEILFSAQEESLNKRYLLQTDIKGVPFDNENFKNYMTLLAYQRGYQKRARKPITTSSRLFNNSPAHDRALMNNSYGGDAHVLEYKNERLMKKRVVEQHQNLLFSQVDNILPPLTTPIFVPETKVDISLLKHYEEKRTYEENVIFGLIQSSSGNTQLKSTNEYNIKSYNSVLRKYKELAETVLSKVFVMALKEGVKRKIGNDLNDETKRLLEGVQVRVKHLLFQSAETTEALLKVFENDEVAKVSIMEQTIGRDVTKHIRKEKAPKKKSDPTPHPENEQKEEEVEVEKKGKKRSRKKLIDESDNTPPKKKVKKTKIQNTSSTVKSLSYGNNPPVNLETVLKDSTT